MSVFLVVVAFLIAGDSMAATTASLVARVSPAAGLLVFFALSILVFGGGWHAAVRVTERHILRHRPRQL